MHRPMSKCQYVNPQYVWKRYKMHHQLVENHLPCAKSNTYFAKSWYNSSANWSNLIFFTQFTLLINLNQLHLSDTLKLFFPWLFMTSDTCSVQILWMSLMLPWFWWPTWSMSVLYPAEVRSIAPMLNPLCPVQQSFKFLPLFSND